MQTPRFLTFVAAALMFVISACSQAPEDLTPPTLEPRFGFADDDIGVDVATVSSGRIYTLSQRYGPHDQSE